MQGRCTTFDQRCRNSARQRGEWCRRAAARRAHALPAATAFARPRPLHALAPRPLRMALCGRPPRRCPSQTRRVTDACFSRRYKSTSPGTQTSARSPAAASAQTSLMRASPHRMPLTIATLFLPPPPPAPRGALKGKEPQRRLGRRLEEAAKAVGGGYCRLQMPLRLALAVRRTVAGHRLGALEGGGGDVTQGGYPPPFQCIPAPPPPGAVRWPNGLSTSHRFLKPPSSPPPPPQGQQIPTPIHTWRMPSSKRDHVRSPGSTTRRARSAVMEYCFCEFVSCPCLAHEAASVPVNVHFCWRYEPAFTLSRALGYSVLGAVASLPHPPDRCSFACGRHRGAAGPGPHMPHPPAPPPLPRFERQWCWGHSANGAEILLCMLPFHQTIHVLSARLARRGADHMFFVPK